MYIAKYSYNYRETNVGKTLILTQKKVIVQQIGLACLTYNDNNNDSKADTEYDHQDDPQLFGDEN